MLMRSIKLELRRFNSRDGDELARPAFKLGSLLSTKLALDTIAGFKAAARFDATEKGHT